MMLSVAASAARTREPKSFSTTAAVASSAGRRKKRSSSVARCLAGTTGTVIVRRVFRLFFFLSVRIASHFGSFHFILSSLSTRIVSYYRSFWGLFHSLFERRRRRRRQQRRRKRRPTGRRGKHPLRCLPARTQESPKIHYSLGFWIFEISFCVSDLI